MVRYVYEPLIVLNNLVFKRSDSLYFQLYGIACFQKAAIFDAGASRDRSGSEKFSRVKLLLPRCIGNCFSD